MEKSLKFYLFYNYSALGDVLVLTNNLSAKYFRHEINNEVCALYDKDNNLYGYNIFNLNHYIKIYEKGLLSYPFDYIVDIVNIILTNNGFNKINYYNFSGVRVGKIIDIDNDRYTISFKEEQVVCSGKYNGVNNGDIILYGYKGVLLPSLRKIEKEDGEILKEKDLFITSNDKYVFLQDETLVGLDFYKGELKNGN